MGKISSNFNIDNKGCSLLFINTEKGRILFKFIKDNLNIILSNKKDCIQPNLTQPSSLNKKSGDFISNYKKYGFIKILKLYSILSFNYKLNYYNTKIIMKIKSILNKI